MVWNYFYNICLDLYQNQEKGLLQCRREFLIGKFHQEKIFFQGDSGGPLVYKDASDTWRQIGIVSFGSDGGCLVGPSVYTRVSSHFTWMSNTIGAGYQLFEF
jgi:secreted trypsin-like serine protease